MGANQEGRPVIGPAEFATLVKIYNAVVAEPWFTGKDDQRNLLRRYILTAYRSGMTDTSELLSHCREMAHQHFYSDI